mmetsp:Transcript_35881/g.78571  ORF Transcript_35881/g.78571 Transcript_35881/m.78571 type:complete len:440 (+) Transcript_35881:80-1399(+)
MFAHIAGLISSGTGNSPVRNKSNISPTRRPTLSSALDWKSRGKAAAAAPSEAVDRPEKASAPSLVPASGSSSRTLPRVSARDLSPDSLEKWRLEEKEFITFHDVGNVDKVDEWYLIDLNWLKEWKLFVKRNGAPPGPIDNSRLIDSQSGLAKPGLRVVDDYRGVSVAVWNFWRGRYGGGPEVQRRRLDLYSTPPSSPREDLEKTRQVRRPPREEEPRSAAASSNRAATPRGRAVDRAAAPKRGKSVPAARGEREDAALCCDKCDGPHATAECPHFRRPREKHKDAWSMFGKADKAGGLDEEVIIVKDARVVTQPGDGSCLFHSLSYGLNDKSTGYSLRSDICDFISRNPDISIGDNALKDWVQYDGGGTVQSYARHMSEGTWGGGIEMAALTKMKQVNVHVYEKCKGGFKRISAFHCPGAQRTVNVLYQGRAHYDALVL